MKLCINCGKEKQSNVGNYCRDCYQKGERNHMFGNVRPEAIRKRISKSMKGINAGEKNPHWRGGKIKDTHGYVHIRVPNHPYAINGYVKRSRLIMEKILGRYLLLKEIIHHENEIRDDDKPENLKLFPCIGEHTSYHNRR